MNLSPFTYRDIRQGRYTPASVSEFLVPQNSVKDAKNVNFDTIVGKAVVRPGTTLVGSAVASGKAPLGIAEFVGKGGSPNYLVAVFKGVSNATAYYWNNSTWTATNKTTLNNTAKTRFATLGGSVFMTNSTDGMFDSSDGATFGTTNSITTVLPSLVYRYAARLLCSGDPTYPSRVYFSSIISPASSPFITWNNNASTGDWIDINPDDGGQVTAFSETSTFVLVFKGNAMYRLDTVNKSTDTQNIFNIGAVSQEAVVACQGLVYFFSGIDIRQTDGGFPQQISRAGVQDIIATIPQTSWASVASGTDGLNVYFFVGSVTLNANTENAVTITNCALKFSPRDQSWSVHSYSDNFQYLCLYTDATNGRQMRGADTGGKLQTINIGTTDNTAAIEYFLETQDLEFGDRSHLKGISDRITVFTKNSADGNFLAKANDVPKGVPMTLNKRINIGKDINLEGNWFNFRWYGQSSTTAPVFEGFSLEKVVDKGNTYA
jgi:hypothetical protein